MVHGHVLRLRREEEYVGKRVMVMEVAGKEGEEDRSGGGWITSAGLDIGLWQPLARGTSESENPLAPQKTHWPPKNMYDPNVFVAGIYDFTLEVAHFCTLLLILGLYITKNKYELTLPSEFCRFPVKITAAYGALKIKIKKHWPLGPVENKLWWPELARQPQKGMRTSGHIANVKA